ncbi:MAG: hypothetical protein JRI39_00390 [Deltaproteobacteria bacterium]|nr:hypothetical protein [Deltaproteobacteria bacterium]
MPYQAGDIISEGTLRIEDLLPIFVSAARELDTQGSWTAWLDGIEQCFESKGYFESDLARDDFEELFQFLQDNAPERTYFGAHPGDGACFGFWPLEEEEE